MASDYQWKPIEDLPADWQSLTDSELPAICKVMADFKALDQGAFQLWAEQAHREWAIETGRIEDVYRFERGVTETLMQRGILPDLIPRKGNSLEPEQIAAIIQDAMVVLDGLFAFEDERPLSKSYIHELHQVLLRNVHSHRVISSLGESEERPLEKGVYKRHANSVKVNGGTHEYCPVDHVAAEMDRLIEMHSRHGDVAPEVSAAWCTTASRRSTLMQTAMDGLRER